MFREAANGGMGHIPMLRQDVGQGYRRRVGWWVLLLCEGIEG